MRQLIEIGGTSGSDLDKVHGDYRKSQHISPVVRITGDPSIIRVREELPTIHQERCFTFRKAIYGLVGNGRLLWWLREDELQAPLNPGLQVSI